MAKRTLAEEIQALLLGRAPGEVTAVWMEKSEGTGKHARVKAVHVDTQRLMFRVLEPGVARAVYVSTKDIPATVTAVHALLARKGVPLNRVGC